MRIQKDVDGSCEIMAGKKRLTKKMWNDSMDDHLKDGQEMTRVPISKHNKNHLLFLMKKHKLSNYDEAIDYVLTKAKLNWQCMDEADYRKIVGGESK